jgi:hypothetical protein
MKKSKRSTAIWVAILFFLMVRAWTAFGYRPLVSDTTLYAFYGFVAHESTRVHKSPYDPYETLRRGLNQTFKLPGPRQDEVAIEYPPLALGLFVLPARLVPENLAGTGLRGNGPDDYDRWSRQYRKLYVIAEMVTVLGMLWWLRQRNLGSAWGLVVGTVGGILLASLLCDRLDLWLGLLLLAAASALVSGWRYLALALLAVAANLKLVPILVLPLFVLGALPAGRRAWRAAAEASAAFVGVGLAVFLPFRAAWGPRAWDFLAFHGERGLQIEATWSSLLLTAAQLGFPAQVVHEHGSGTLVAPGARFLAQASTLVVLATTAAVTWWYWRATTRPGPADASPPSKETTLAEREPQRFVWALLAVLALAAAGSKVFSPQYLCWFLPLFLLVDTPRSWRTAWPVIAFVVACVLTMIVFPFLWDEMEYVVSPSPLTLRLPSLRATLTNLSRNIVWIAFGVGAVLAMRRGEKPAVAPALAKIGPRGKPRKRRRGR